MTADRERLVATTLREAGPFLPLELRATIEEQVAGAKRRAQPPAARSHRRHVQLRLGLAGAVAVALAGLVLALPLGPGGAPNVVEAHELGSRAIAASPPASPPGRPQLLNRRVDGVSFPNWRGAFAWRARGQRTDDLGGRTAATVFYEHQGHTVSYTIVSGKALERPAGAEHLRVKGVDLYRFRHGGHDVVVFERQGKTCVISGHVEHRDTLTKLASWQGKGRVTF